MIYSILFLLLSALSYWFWKVKYIPAQVARNLAAFDADGANDSLQRGFHSREVWRRVWPGLACCLVPALPLLLGQGVWGGVLAFLSVAALLAGVFARDFTPKLNLARLAAGQWWITEFTASKASKSWPDAKAWKWAWRTLPGYDGPGGDDDETNAKRQAAADTEMKAIIRRTYRLCLAASLLLAGAAVAVIFMR